MEIFLVRHTKVAVEESICYGQHDVPLSNSFEKELITIREKLPISSETPILSSPLTRCLQLAKALNSANVKVDKRLLEINFGEFEMMEWEQIKRTYNELFQDYVNSTPPGGESYMDLYKRVVKFYKELISNRLNVVILVTHAGVIRSILAYILKIPLEKAFSLQISYGGVSKVTIHSEEYIDIDYVNK